MNDDVFGLNVRYFVVKYSIFVWLIDWHLKIIRFVRLYRNSHIIHQIISDIVLKLVVPIY